MKKIETLIISRHAGAMGWIQKHHPEFAECELITHASPEILKGKRVIGILPIQLAVLATEFWNLSLNVPANMRGKELTIEDMEKFDCKIEQFQITKS